MSRINRPKNGDVAEAITYARHCLEQKLPPQLTYHNLTHTFEHVLPAALDLADRCGVAQEEKDLLAVAAAFHDIGWIVQGKGHEPIGAEMARQKLPGFGFSERQIDRIANMILATRLPHQPASLLDRILVDADMAVLSREDFWHCNGELRCEVELLGETVSDCEWYESQLAFLEAHRYFTTAAVESYEPAKKKHILEIRHLLETCQAEPDFPRQGLAQAESLVKSENDA